MLFICDLSPLIKYLINSVSYLWISISFISDRKSSNCVWTPDLFHCKMQFYFCSQLSEFLCDISDKRLIKWRLKEVVSWLISGRTSRTTSRRPSGDFRRMNPTKPTWPSRQRDGAWKLISLFFLHLVNISGKYVINRPWNQRIWKRLIQETQFTLSFPNSSNNKTEWSIAQAQKWSIFIVQWCYQN